VQEVRRFYPFFPFVVAKARKDFEWKGYGFKKGTRVFLDLYGTNHHRDSYKEPYQFNPDRFNDRAPSAFDLIPQGGGEHHSHHRCAGEGITVEAMKVGTQFLAASIDYVVPDQDLRLELDRFPALPKSRMVIREVKKIKPSWGNGGTMMKG